MKNPLCARSRTQRERAGRLSLISVCIHNKLFRVHGSRQVRRGAAQGARGGFSRRQEWVMNSRGPLTPPPQSIFHAGINHKNWPREQSFDALAQGKMHLLFAHSRFAPGIRRNRCD